MRFKVYPVQRSAAKSIEAEAPLVDRRSVRSSSGEAQRRLVIETTVEVMGERLKTEVTLTRRDAMGFRMLLGRLALRDHFLVDGGRSFYGGLPKKRSKKKKARRS